MISVKRGKDYFDQQFFSNDMESFRKFFSDANNYDSRIELVERWIVRKEDEIKARVQLPP
jgi:cytochrome c-type biogenesis protein CcmH/NrfG